MIGFMDKNLQPFRIIQSEAAGELTEKKSRFICRLCPITSEEEAIGVIEQEKKTYWDARHHCHAFILGEGSEIMRYGDDGEPGGTAGRPMLEVLKGAELTNCLAVVTRYFGGTLLGTGGLVRAYSGAVQAALENASPVWMCPGISLSVLCDYQSSEKIKYQLMQKYNMSPADTIYDAAVTLIYTAPAGILESLQKTIADLTAGKAVVTVLGETRYASETRPE
jgi:uncharacterized YigZ family protein